MRSTNKNKGKLGSRVMSDKILELAVEFGMMALAIRKKISPPPTDRDILLRSVKKTFDKHPDVKGHITFKDNPNKTYTYN